jgi:hypothetical protein
MKMVDFIIICNCKGVYWFWTLKFYSILIHHSLCLICRCNNWVCKIYFSFWHLVNDISYSSLLSHAIIDNGFYTNNNLIMSMSLRNPRSTSLTSIWMSKATFDFCFHL